MGFPLADLRRTVRRSRSGDSLQLYPRLLLGPAPLPKIAVAIRYFESMLGKRRGELQPGVLVEFLGDARLARCIVACLARAYRYRTRDFAEVVGPESARRLADDGIWDARALRLRLFKLANEVHAGFLPPAERADLLQPALAAWGLSVAELDELIAVDAEDQQLLERSTRMAPEPSDVAALYNYLTLETALRAASRVVLESPTLDRSALKRFGALLRRYGVAGRVERAGAGARYTLYGRQDALGSWTRHGGRVARVLTRLLHTTATSAGTATVELRGKPHQMRLDADTLDNLRGRPSVEPATAAIEPLSGALETEFRREFATLRRQGLAAGWTVRRDPDPVVLDQCIFLPDLALANRGQRVLIALATTPAAARGLAETLPAVAGKAAVVALVAADVRDLLGEVGVPVLTFEDSLPVFELVALLRSGIALQRETGLTGSQCA